MIEKKWMILLTGIFVMIFLVNTASADIRYTSYCINNSWVGLNASVWIDGTYYPLIQEEYCEHGCNYVTNTCVVSNLPVEMYLPISLVFILSAFVFAYLGTQMKEHGSLQLMFLLFALYMIVLSTSNVMQFNTQTQEMALNIVTNGYLVGIYAIFLTLLYFFLKLFYRVLMSALGQSKGA